MALPDTYNSHHPSGAKSPRRESIVKLLIIAIAALFVTITPAPARAQQTRTSMCGPEGTAMVPNSHGVRVRVFCDTPPPVATPVVTTTVVTTELPRPVENQGGTSPQGGLSPVARLAPPPPPPLRPMPVVAIRPAPLIVVPAPPPPPPPVATPVVTTVATTEPPPIPTDPTTRPVWVGFREDRPANRRAWEIRAIVCFAPTVAEAQNARGRAVCRRWSEGSGWVSIPRTWNWNQVVAIIGAGVVPAPTDLNPRWQNYHYEFYVAERDAPRRIMVTSEDATEGSHSLTCFLPRHGRRCR